MKMTLNQLRRYAKQLGYDFKQEKDWDELIAWPIDKPKQTIHVGYDFLYATKEEKADAIQEMVATLAFGKSKEETERAMQCAMQRK